MHTKDLQSTLVRVGWTYHYDDITGGCLCRSYVGVILGLLSISTHGEHITEAKFVVSRVFQGRHNPAISLTIYPHSCINLDEFPIPSGDVQLPYQTPKEGTAFAADRQPMARSFWAVAGD